MFKYIYKSYSFLAHVPTLTFNWSKLKPKQLQTFCCEPSVYLVEDQMLILKVRVSSLHDRLLNVTSSSVSSTFTCVHIYKSIEPIKTVSNPDADRESSVNRNNRWLMVWHQPLTDLLHPVLQLVTLEKDDEHWFVNLVPLLKTTTTKWHMLLVCFRSSLDFCQSISCALYLTNMQSKFKEMT